MGELTLPNPDSIINKYEYDPVTNKYIYREILGDFNVQYPLFLTPKEFESLIEQEQRSTYFRDKIKAFSGKTEGSEEARKNLLPIFYVNNDFFKTIFGSDAIEIIPQGSAEIDLGFLYTKQENPSFAPDREDQFTFDFDQRISLGLLGKIGTRLQINANFDTQSTFDFQNQIKLEYTPTEDDIIQSIEVGNVTMPINNSLIQGSQSLFGAKIGMQFGRTSVTAVYSDQNSETRSVSVEGGGTVERFEIFAANYDQDRHYFLSHYFRDTYDQSLTNYPFINSNVQITRIEVWVTNRATNAQTLSDARNIVALQDLGEAPVTGNFNIPTSLFNVSGGALPDNGNNDLDPFAISPSGPVTPTVRRIAQAQQGFVGPIANFNEGFDYAILENAKQLSPNEYTLNPQLGYISLNQRLSNDELLAVAFQYTVGGRVFQVGEFANDGVDATDANASINADGTTNTNQTQGNSQSLVVKMLRSPIVNVDRPIWDLMMKNIYNTGAFSIDPADFRMNIVYKNPSPLNYLEDVEGDDLLLPDDVEDTRLLRVFQMDRLNPNSDPVLGGDGFFDYVPGITIDPENGRIIFTTVEPFGQHLFNKLDNDGVRNPADYDSPNQMAYNANQLQYVYRSLYNTTQVIAEQEEADKNLFQLRGSYKSSGQDGISLGAFNVPQGSVTVTAGGRVLQEGTDYTVNYQLGRVTILDEALLASNVPIDVSTENNAVFGQNQKRFAGIDVEHKFSEDLILGATFLNLKERPITQKATYSFEPINNTLVGFNLNYNTEIPFLTRMVNKLPNIDTDVPSNVSIRAEGAYLFANAPSRTDFDGRVTSYVDDFEGAQTTIDVSSALSWELSSVPIGFGQGNAGTVQSGIESGYRRAKMSWYQIAPNFYQGNRPDGVSDQDIQGNTARRILNNEIFPQEQIVPGQTQALFSLDINYNPTERGPYNFNPRYAPDSNNPPNPEDNFGGIIRQLTSTNFEQSNVEFIEFWLMDPFYDNNGTQEPLTQDTSGTIVFNLGNISEDVLKDGRKQFENGLPTSAGNTAVIESDYARVPANQSLVYAFDSDGQDRVNQDAGFDGLTDEAERIKYPAFSSLEDPSADNFEYFLQASGSVLERYENFNGTEGNSPVAFGDTDRGSTTFPTAEDVNRDNTMNTIDSYFEYRIPIFDGMNVGNDGGTGYISDVPEPVPVPLEGGGTISTRWIRFKIPIYEPTEPFNISDFRSIRFMRMYLTNFDQPVLLRFATLDLIRGDYRRYIQPGNTTNNPTLGINLKGDDVIVTSVSVEETPTYQSPPGVIRESLVNNNTEIPQDERSLALTVLNLNDQDSRAVYKNFNIDMRQYENLEMFLHAESVPGEPLLNDGDLSAFIRMGSDFTNNFYQIEKTLQVSRSNTSAEDVWPEANEIDLPLSFLQELKSRNIGRRQEPGVLNLESVPDRTNLQAGIVGNPSIGDVRVIMVGIKNNRTGQTVSGSVWFNELRLSELRNRGGWATVASMDGNIADFANVSSSGRISTIGFGGIEQGPLERSLEDLKEYDITTNLNLGQLLPKKWGVQIPFNYSRGEQLITPLYDQLYEDIEYEQQLINADNQQKRDSIFQTNTEYTRRQSVNLIGLRKERVGDKKPMPYDVENLTLSGTYNQTDHRDFVIKESLDQDVQLNATYDYSFQPKEIEPFKNIGFLNKSKYFDLIKDFNFNLLPTSLSASSTINRQFNKQQFREVNFFNDGAGGELPELFQRNFLFDWQYGINHNVSKSLNINFTSSNNRILKDFIDDEGAILNENEIDIWSGLFEVGDANFHSQQIQANYELPLNKIPLFKFIRSTYSYTADFQWTKGSEALKNIDGVPDQGNTVQNSNAHTLSSNLDMNSLYKYLGLVKKKPGRNRAGNKNNGSPARTGKDSKKSGTKDDKGQKGKSKRTKSKLSPVDKVVNTAIGLVTAVKKVSVNYQENNGTFLPGYVIAPGFVGTLKPTTAFTFGSQEEVRDIAARNGWLTLDQNFNQQYRETEDRTLNIQANLGLLKDFSVDISANRAYSETYNENYRVDTENNDNPYVSLSPNVFGNYSISTILIGTSFKKSSAFNSETFEEFKSNRAIIARRLAQQRGLPGAANGEAFPVGLNGTNQAVLLPAFLAAYSGKDAESINTGAFRDIPLPNWDVKYTGLMNLKWFKKRFKRFSINHAYRSSYTINQFQTNLDFADPFFTNLSNPNLPQLPNPNGVDQGGNYKNPILYSNVTLSEQFSPLVRLDMDMKNSVKLTAEVKRDRTLSLSFDNNLLTETQGNEYVVGMGYRIQDLTFVTKVGGKKTTLKSDLNLRADLSLRQNETVVRYLDIDNPQITAGQDIYTIKFTADYALSKNLTALFFYDHTFSEYSISTAFPQTSIRSGITLRYNFGN
ncbi:cell surface protein SprA [Aquimarina sp. ERC-38]|uniref:T9SS outer membrane translocon Sov/SprA n=1 Tax=Aquimarina sp. ERC-38 TaxID=2949996 RepID=UPI002247E18E|nr:cell surface protein SprA [Aquimarina sp. ERC-38]UZO81208.1 cell surface protein SprA [Aquimarina sp. ERC-38]